MVRDWKREVVSLLISRDKLNRAIIYLASGSVGLVGFDFRFNRNFHVDRVRRKHGGVLKHNDMRFNEWSVKCLAEGIRYLDALLFEAGHAPATWFSVVHAMYCTGIVEHRCDGCRSKAPANMGRWGLDATGDHNHTHRCCCNINWKKHQLICSDNCVG